jgi:hypothetical protein
MNGNGFLHLMLEREKMPCCNEKKKPLTEYSIVKAGQSIIKQLIDPSYDAFASTEIKEERMKTCKECEKIAFLVNKPMCSVCGCFLTAKTSLIDQDCPHPEGSKWPKE